MWPSGGSAAILGASKTEKRSEARLLPAAAASTATALSIRRTEMPPKTAKKESDKGEPKSAAASQPSGAKVATIEHCKS